MHEKQMNGQTEDDLRYLPQHHDRINIEEEGDNCFLPFILNWILICSRFVFVCLNYGEVQVWRKSAQWGSSFREYCALKAPQS